MQATVHSALTRTDDAILQVENLRTHFPVHRSALAGARGWVKAEDGVSFEVERGRTLGLVGESGCGKTTLGRTILRLIPATSGKVYFEGTDVFDLPPAELRRLRRQMQIIFQDPLGSLNPRMTVETIVGEALGVHRLTRSARQRRERVAELLSWVGLSADHLRSYPHELSGGQRQRVGLARALSLEPKFIVCDEPVSALDVSIQAQILNLLADLQRELRLSYLLIAHNLAVVRHFCDEVAVMYLGKIVEHAPAQELFHNALHPYAQALLAAAPEPDPRGRRERGVVLGGEVPSPLDPPPGCAFHPRCPLADQRCRRETPTLQQHDGPSPAHRVACHLAVETTNPSPSQSPVG
ncbi:MAG TPA: oligopeptide/dipeptide ABC transporter ATP-binding protein [Phycisphaerae bacterium]|nr:oligopeptide/dipeptide ABC transporter ATP-binding protein [Phycisphaerae bacterium]